MILRIWVGLLASAVLNQAAETVCEVKTRSYVIPAPTTIAANVTGPGAGFPIPPLDEQIFSLQVFQSGNRPLRRRQGTSTGFLSSIGGILPSCQSAADYHLRNGALASNSLSFSTSQGVRNGEFRATQVQGPITTFFTLHGGFLEWRNAAFDGGAARFCARESQPLLVVFTGAVPEGCSSVALKAVPRSACSAFTSVGETVSNTEAVPTQSSPGPPSSSPVQQISPTTSSTSDPMTFSSKQPPSSTSDSYLNPPATSTTVQSSLASTSSLASSDSRSSTASSTPDVSQFSSLTSSQIISYHNAVYQHVRSHKRVGHIEYHF
ncbi:MAG: hypothetical protein L6R36_002700 [Xanthoria steineri]|nr:MAG: hypothetical protein L6R36_002700 [Xanthoria steineri]